MKLKRIMRTRARNHLAEKGYEVIETRISKIKLEVCYQLLLNRYCNESGNDHKKTHISLTKELTRLFGSTLNTEADNKEIERKEAE